MELSIGNIITLVTCLVSVGVSYGIISQQIKILTKEVEKHNNVIERIYVLEERGNSNTRRLDILEGKSCNKCD